MKKVFLILFIITACKLKQDDTGIAVDFQRRAFEQLQRYIISNNKLALDSAYFNINQAIRLDSFNFSAIQTRLIVLKSLDRHKELKDYLLFLRSKKINIYSNVYIDYMVGKVYLQLNNIDSARWYFKNGIKAVYREENLKGDSSLDIQMFGYKLLLIKELYGNSNCKLVYDSFRSKSLINDELLEPIYVSVITDTLRYISVDKIY